MTLRPGETSPLISSGPPPVARLSSHATGVFWLLLPGLGVLLVASVILAVAIGAVHLPAERVLRILVSHVFPNAFQVDWTPTDDQIVWMFRLPRVLLAIIVGSALAVSGTTLQAMVRNPLADPFLFGISSGASLAAVAVITLGSAAVGGLSLSFAAFLGAFATTLVVFLLAQRNGRVIPMRLVLGGVALGYVLSAATSFLVLRSATPGGGAAAVLSWLAGSLGGAKWEHLGLPSLILVLATGALILQSRALNTLLLGEESAIGLGINVQQFRLQLFFISSLLVGTVVAISGSIGFVGLLVPHIVRMFVGSDHRRVLPLAALMGGVYMVLVDLVGRTVLAPQELPVGIVTAALGGPFFIWLMIRNRQPGADRG
jgi:iron complex transport system permease protein